METNKNKLIFYIFGGIIVFLFFIFFVFIIFNDGNKNKPKTRKKGDLIIWTLFNDLDGRKIVDNFKKKYPVYNSSKIDFHNFSNYEEYIYTLASAISKDEAPDIFVLNNNEKSIFEEKALALDNSKINISQFRKDFKSIFTDDLIKKFDGGEKEYLIGIPVGYETLGVFYNKKFIKSVDLKTLSTLNSSILNSDNNITPIGIGNGRNVKYVSDIATQFLLLDKGEGKSIDDLNPSQIRDGLGTYINYGYSSSGNNFNSLEKDALKLFSSEEIAMLVGYPRFIEDIDETGGFSSRYLFVEPFPHNVPGQGYTLANYNYFVINKDSPNIPVAETFLKFLATKDGANSFMESYSYYLPALLSLENSLDTKKIDDDYNIVLGDFYKFDYELTSFNKGIKLIYDREIKNILDLGSGFKTPFNNFRNSIICKTNKLISLKDLSSSCD